jgi:hypothetical protein
MPGSQTGVLNDFFPNELDFFLTPTPPCPQNPTDPSVTVCTPKNGASVISPVNVVAGTNSSVSIVSLAVWLDGQKVFNTGQSLLNTTVAMTPPTHLLAVQGINGAKQVFTQTLTLTARGGACQASTQTPSQNICNPVNNSTVASPFPVQSAAHMANAVKVSEVWLDGLKRFQVASASVNTSIAAAAGTHRLTVQTIDVAGVVAKQTIFVTVSTSFPPPCTPSSADPSVTICTPALNATVTSPVSIVAATTDSAAAVTNMFVWADGVKKLTVPGGTVNTSLPVASGKRRITVQAKDSAGRYFQSTVNVTVQ